MSILQLFTLKLLTMNQFFQKLTASRFKELQQAHLSLDDLYCLQVALSGYSLEDFKEKRITLIIQKLKRMNYLDAEGSVTDAGKELYLSLFEEREEALQLSQMKDSSEEFELWWKAYPSTDGFEMYGKKFTGSRSLKVYKSKCKILFTAILAEGYTLEEMLAALETEIKEKKDRSIREKTNCMQWMKATQSYLNSRGFEGYVERLREAKEKPQRGGETIYKLL